jgi:diguanylate cyclase (GGDEF)-like protein
MYTLLAPGMALLRRVGVAGKFGVLAVVLLVPIVISGAASFRTDSGSIAVVQRERSGLRYLDALAQLHMQIGTLRDVIAHGQVASPAVLTAIQDVDELDAQLGATFRVHPRWQELRAQLSALGEVTLDQEASLSRVRTADWELDRLAAAVADSSGLITDTRLDAYYVVIVLVDRIPRLLEARAEANQLAAEAQPGTVGVDLAVALRQMTGVDQQLRSDLDKAWQATRSAQLQRQTSAEVAAVTQLVDRATSRLAMAAGGSPYGDTRVDGRVAGGLSESDLPVAVARLSARLTTGLSGLLGDREEQLRQDRFRHTVLTAAPVLLSAYLFLALFRSTAGAVRRLLDDISAVTDGPAQDGDPLPGKDEFAQMSRAVAYTRDHLTGLLGELRYSATHDQLTALANRNLFTEKLREALAGPPVPLAVVLLDLDGFKDLNDSFGHGLGDRLLQVVGARFHRVTRRDDLVARFGGDEFALLLTDVDQQAAGELVAQVHRSLEQPVDLEGRPLRLRVSAGIATGIAGGIDAVELIRNADVALYAAKAAGKGRSATFEPQMHDHTVERTELSVDLAQAVAAGDLVTHYQPLVDLVTGQVHGVEALARWHHAERGWVSPSLFIPLAETTGLIDEIGRQMLVAGVRTLAWLRDEFPDHPPLTMDVNLSAPQLGNDALVGEIMSLVDETGIDPSWLVLEITESALVEDVETALRRLGQLAATGVRIALDDFGTGYSSLSYLRRLPIHMLKIDKSFVDDLGHGDDLDQGDGRSRALLQSIVGIARSLGLQSVAEGIETPAQAAVLRDLGCTLGQGYLFSRPVTAHQVRELLRAQHRLPTQRSAASTSERRTGATFS